MLPIRVGMQNAPRCRATELAGARLKKAHAIGGPAIATSPGTPSNARRCPSFLFLFVNRALYSEGRGIGRRETGVENGQTMQRWVWIALRSSFQWAVGKSRSVSGSIKAGQATYPRKSSLMVPMALIAATSGLTPRIFRRKLVPFSITWSA